MISRFVLRGICSLALLSLVLTSSNAVSQTTTKEGVATKESVVTKEDSLSVGIIAEHSSTVIGGYGEAHYIRDLRADTAQMDLRRVVVFVGHEFTPNISLFSELEVEDAKVSGGSVGGEVAFEQAYVKFDLDRNTHLTAGLFLPRIGITNENHLPTTFNGVERTYVETMIIPSTWRELGVGIWGRIDQIPGLNYSAAVLNGLNSANLQYGSGIVEGRAEGRNAGATNLAITGALLYYLNNFRLQVSGYFGGSTNLTAHQADSVGLKSGPFGTPVELGEADAEYKNGGLSIRALGTIIKIPDAANINRVYSNNTPSEMAGAYVEVGYDLLRMLSSSSTKEFILFARYEALDLNASIPTNGTLNGTLAQKYFVAGITYRPIVNIAIKADYTAKSTGTASAQLLASPFGESGLGNPNNSFLDLGIAYSF